MENIDNVYVGEINENGLSVKYRVTYQPESASVICKSDNSDWNKKYFFDFIKHMITVDDGDSYFMHRYPGYLTKFLFPIWEEVLENYPFYSVIGDLMNDNYEYLEHCKLRVAKKVKDSKIFEKKKIKDYKPEVINELYNEKTYDFLFASYYKGEEIIFAVNILTGRIGVLYDEKEYVYNAQTLPQKYYRYMELYIDFVISKMMLHSSDYKNTEKSLELQRNWKVLKSNIVSYLADRYLIYPLT